MPKREWETKEKDLGDYVEYTFPKRTIIVKKREKDWSKRARAKGYGVEYSTLKYYRNKGVLVIRIPQKLQRGWFDAIDYVVVEKGKLGQGKYRKELLHKPEIERMRRTRLCYPGSELSLELSYRPGPHRPIRREPIE